MKPSECCQQTPNAHSKVLWLETFNNTPSLSEFFTLLGTSKDPVTGQEFVALVEGKKYPIYASQFHPEKLLKTGAPNRINQSDVNFSLYFARFLVNEALNKYNLPVPFPPGHQRFSETNSEFAQLDVKQEWQRLSSRHPA